MQILYSIITALKKREAALGVRPCVVVLPAHPSRLYAIRYYYILICISATTAEINGTCAAETVREEHVRATVGNTERRRRRPNRCKKPGGRRARRRRQQQQTPSADGRCRWPKYVVVVGGGRPSRLFTNDALLPPLPLDPSPYGPIRERFLFTTASPFSFFLF